MLLRGPPITLGEAVEPVCLGDRPLGHKAFLIESLAWGLLRAYGISGPPVPVREMIEHPLPMFERLSLLELNLGLYDATYRTCLDGVRLIVVDLAKPHVVQRASAARALYLAFCRSSRAAELAWSYCEHPCPCGDLFARCLLMPAAWMRRACTPLVTAEELAARFDVPIEMADRRLSDVGCEGRYVV